MFGLELGIEDDSKETKEPVFDVEQLIKDPEQLKSIIENINCKICDLKTLLLMGIEEEEFKQASILLEGYKTLKKTLKTAPARNSFSQSK